MKRVLRIFSLTLITVMLCLALVSCGGPNSDPDKALDALKDNDITWCVKDEYGVPTALKYMGIDGVDCVVTGTGKINDKYAHITIVYFDEEADAKEAYEKVDEYAETYKKDAEESDWVFKKSGNMIYYGTKDAVKAAK